MHDRGTCLDLQENTRVK